MGVWLIVDGESDRGDGAGGHQAMGDAAMRKSVLNPMALVVVSRSGSWKPKTANDSTSGSDVLKRRDTPAAAIAAWVIAIISKENEAPI